MRNIAFTLALALSLVTAAGARTSLDIEGTTNLTPLLSKAAASFEAQHNGTHLIVKGTSSGAGIAALKDGSIDIAASDIAVNDTGLSNTTIGVVGFAFVTNKDAGVKNLTRKQLIEIFSGRVTNWKAVGGADQPIVIISRDIGTGTRLVLEEKVAKTLVQTKVVSNANKVIEAVAQTPGAIGYVASYFTRNRNDLVVAYNGIKPTPQTIRDHSYAFSTDEHLYIRNNASPETKSFITTLATNKPLLTAYGIY